MKLLNRTGKALHKRAACCHANRASTSLLGDLLSQRSALLDDIRKYDGMQDDKVG